jgi:hypothetical protein
VAGVAQRVPGRPGVQAVVVDVHGQRLAGRHVDALAVAHRAVLAELDAQHEHVAVRRRRGGLVGRRHTGGGEGQGRGSCQDC